MSRRRQDLKGLLVICAGAATVLFLLSVLAFLFDITGAGADSLFPLLAAYFFASLLTCRFFLFGDFFEPGAELFAGDEAVHLSGSFALDLYLNVRGRMLKEDARRGFVDFLPTTTGAANELLDKVVFEDTQRGHALFQGFLFIG